MSDLPRQKVKRGGPLLPQSTHRPHPSSKYQFQWLGPPPRSPIVASHPFPLKGVFRLFVKNKPFGIDPGSRQGFITSNFATVRILSSWIMNHFCVWLTALVCRGSRRRQCSAEATRAFLRNAESRSAPSLSLQHNEESMSLARLLPTWPGVKYCETVRNRIIRTDTIWEMQRRKMRGRQRLFRSEEFVSK